MIKPILWLVATGVVGGIALHAVLTNLASAPRRELFAELQPVALANCTLARFGEAHDGGYLMCANLLGGVESAYSYGINGYDGWGCQVSEQLRVPVHEYDCFNTAEPICPRGKLVFHAECVGPPQTLDGRVFDTLAHQIERNGDRGKRLVVKMDVEGAEWESLLSAPAELLARIDQLVVEFHGIQDRRFVALVKRLKTHFHVAHLHFNNNACRPDAGPFPAIAYEVLFVNKAIASIGPGGRVALPHALDAPNTLAVADCQDASP